MTPESRSELALNVRYPRTPYWPWSPTIGRNEIVHANPDRFVGEDVVATEKLDGGNTLLHAGRVYARSVSAPSEGKWMAMVKKHHAWKVSEPDVYLYGEDIYGVHSIAYEPVAEHETFRAFALRQRRRRVCGLRRGRILRGAAGDTGRTGPLQGALPVSRGDQRVHAASPRSAVRARR